MTTYQTYADQFAAALTEARAESCSVTHEIIRKAIYNKLSFHDMIIFDDIIEDKLFEVFAQIERRIIRALDELWIFNETEPC